MTTVGYYDISSGEAGPSYFTTPITEAGQTAAPLSELTTSSLAGLDTLFLLNPDNGGYGAEFLASLPAVWEFANQGGTVIIQDRYVENAELILPGLAGVQIIRDTASPESATIDFVDDDGAIADGPGGTLNDMSLDGGNRSNHGYAIRSSLPVGVTVIHTTSDPDQVVTFSYEYGGGTIVYSTIPLDYHLSNSEVPGMDVYAVNLLERGLIRAQP